ncbi:hypothetical protein CPC08DRAFT_816211 [Agrocybe pediades]|nr:hypothetical protein CPC08DRAFT_816211 [Agrocybe pediades]
MSSQNSGDKNPDYVARGLKATIHNERTSEEAKESAAQRLEEMGAEVPSDFAASNDSSNSSGKGGQDEEEGLNPNQIRGYKSTLARDNVSDEAKEHAKQVLEENDAA